MISQQATYADSTLSDFSTALLRVKNNDQNSAFAAERSVHALSNGSTPAPNRNLSSVLSQIQDDGPAYNGPAYNSSSYTGSAKRGAAVGRKTNNKSDSDSIGQQGKVNNNAIHRYSSAELLQQAMMATDETDLNAKNRSWPQWLLMLSVSAVTALSLFMLYTKTIDMEATLNLYDARINGDMGANANEQSPNIMTINETLQSVQQELQFIKTDYSASDARYLATITDKISPQIDEAVSIKDNVNALKDEMLILRSELQAVSNKFKAKSKDNNKGNRAGNKTVASNGWVINLASLSNKIMAEKSVKQLVAAGLSPSIQEAVVNGQHVYRLSVGGFTNRNEAELFVREAGNKYGMKNGWIRKS
jgi:hypothetical protein